MTAACFLAICRPFLLCQVVQWSSTIPEQDQKPGQGSSEHNSTLCRLCNPNWRTNAHATLYRGDFEREMRASVLNKLPSVLREREFPCWKWKEFDKGFACVSDSLPPGTSAVCSAVNVLGPVKDLTPC